MISFSDFVAFAGLIVVWQFGEQIARWTVRGVFLKSIIREVKSNVEEIRNSG